MQQDHGLLCFRNTMKILMVCLGNICRSPMAQGILEKEIQRLQLPWSVDSAGTNGYHDGENPDPRAIQTMRSVKWDISSQISRKVKTEDFEIYDLILCMDRAIEKDLLRMFDKQNNLNKVKRLMEFSPTKNHLEVEDPYYNNRFEEALQRIELGVNGLVQFYTKQN